MMSSTERQLADLLHNVLTLLQHVSVEAGVCCCGNTMGHGCSNDHAPVDQGAYAMDMWANEALSVLDSLDYYDDEQADADANALKLPSGMPVELIDKWHDLKQQVATLSGEEMTLRKALFNTLFPDKEEGSSSMKMGDGRVLGGTGKINRTVDAETLSVLDSDFREHGIPVDALIKWSPSLVVSEYRLLTAEQVAEFDQTLTIKPGAPTLEIRLPKKKKGKA